MCGPNTKGAQQRTHQRGHPARARPIAHPPVASAWRIVRPPRPGPGNVRKAGGLGRPHGLRAARLRPRWWPIERTSTIPGWAAPPPHTCFRPAPSSRGGGGPLSRGEGAGAPSEAPAEPPRGFGCTRGRPIPEDPGAA
eukprot:scaffold1465_cov383-Prasinococcus_capsulatus_cf.AAC.3